MSLPWRTGRQSLVNLFLEPEMRSPHPHLEMVTLPVLCDLNRQTWVDGNVWLADIYPHACCVLHGKTDRNMAGTHKSLGGLCPAVLPAPHLHLFFFFSKPTSFCCTLSLSLSLYLPPCLPYLPHNIYAYPQHMLPCLLHTKRKMLSQGDGSHSTAGEEGERHFN